MAENKWVTGVEKNPISGVVGPYLQLVGPHFVIDGRKKQITWTK